MKEMALFTVGKFGLSHFAVLHSHQEANFPTLFYGTIINRSPFSIPLIDIKRIARCVDEIAQIA